MWSKMYARCPSDPLNRAMSGFLGRWMPMLYRQHKSMMPFLMSSAKGDALDTMWSPAWCTVSLMCSMNASGCGSWRIPFFDVYVLPIERIKDLCDVSTNSDEHLILDLRRCQVRWNHSSVGWLSLHDVDWRRWCPSARTNHGSCQRCTAPQSRYMILPDGQIPICLLIGATMSGQLRPWWADALKDAARAFEGLLRGFWWGLPDWPRWWWPLPRPAAWWTLEDGHVFLQKMKAKMLSLSDGDLDVTQRSAARTIDGELHQIDALRQRWCLVGIQWQVHWCPFRWSQWCHVHWGRWSSRCRFSDDAATWLRTKLIEFGRLMQLKHWCPKRPKMSRNKAEKYSYTGCTWYTQGYSTMYMWYFMMMPWSCTSLRSLSSRCDTRRLPLCVCVCMFVFHGDGHQTAVCEFVMFVLHTYWWYSCLFWWCCLLFVGVGWYQHRREANEELLLLCTWSGCLPNCPLMVPCVC